MIHKIAKNNTLYQKNITIYEKNFLNIQLLNMKPENFMKVKPKSKKKIKKK